MRLIIFLTVVAWFLIQVFLIVFKIAGIGDVQAWTWSEVLSPVWIPAAIFGALWYLWQWYLCIQTIRFFLK